jgi:poly-gamma-glutamate capsule biosynthesis protein CapA/YwtB (metallophosphatase superfamily)
MPKRNLRIFATVTALVLAGFALAFFLPKPKIRTFEKVPAIKDKPKLTTLFFGGDIMLSRNVAAQIYKAGDFSLPFKNVSEKISAADIAFANLESPFNDKGDHSVEGSLVFNADPKSVEGLELAGFDVLSTANNHAFDQGTKGIHYTQKWLEENEILPLGTGSSCHDGQIIIKNNIKFGFLGYSYTALNDGGKTTDPLVCDSNNLVQLAKDIKLMRPKVDYLIVSTHMGLEYTRTPTEAQVNFAHNAIDAGADLIIGNHPHWVQTIEQYNGKWIFYAMGNLVFDQMWSQETREGLTATISFRDKALEKIELTPVIIDDFCCPRWASSDETKNILEKIDLTSTVLVPHN